MAWAEDLPGMSQSFPLNTHSDSGKKEKGCQLKTILPNVHPWMTQLGNIKSNYIDHTGLTELNATQFTDVCRWITTPERPIHRWHSFIML